MKQKTKLIMFDYDGVIMDSNHCPLLFYNELSRQMGIRKFKDWQECRNALEANYKLTLRKVGLKTEEEFKRAEKIFEETTDMWKNLELFPKVKQMLLELKKQGYKMAIVSNNREEIIIPDLKKHKILDLFDHVIDKKYGHKPETTQLTRCLKLTGTYPDQAVMIDDMDGGLIAAKNVKLKKAIGVSYGYQPRSKLTMADVIVDSPEEIILHIE